MASGNSNRERVQFCHRVHNLKVRVDELYKLLEDGEKQFAEDHAKSYAILSDCRSQIGELKRKHSEQEPTLLQARQEVQSGAARRLQLQQQVEQLKAQLLDRDNEIWELRRSKEGLSASLAESSTQLQVERSQVVLAEKRREEEKLTLAEQRDTVEAEVATLKEEKSRLEELSQELAKKKKRSLWSRFKGVFRKN